MDLLLQEIEQALKHGLYYLAIAMALTIPDTCAGLASQAGSTDSKAYKKWYVDNLSAKYPQITPVDMWNLRNAVLHQGRFRHPHTQYSRFLFTVPGPIRFHQIRMADVLDLDVEMFCRDMTEAARAWLIANAANPFVVANQPNLVRLRPDGLAPYFIGVPVIA